PQRAERRIARLHAAGAGNPLLLHEGVGRERGRDGAARAPADATGHVAEVEGVVLAGLDPVVGGIRRRAQVVGEAEASRRPEIVREAEVLPVADARAARDIDLPRVEGAVRRAEAG